MKVRDHTKIVGATVSFAEPGSILLINLAIVVYFRVTFIVAIFKPKMMKF